MGSEEKVKKAMVDAARLADELRAEQDHVAVQTKNKRSLETTMADMENRLADANESAMKGGKAAMAKLESRIRELEIELGNVQARTSDNLKGHQKAERKIKELQFQNDEDKKNQVAMSDLAGKLQAKTRPTRSRSRRLRRSPPSTWPSSGRPSRSWRRPRTVPGWLSLPFTTKLLT